MKLRKTWFHRDLLSTPIAPDYSKQVAQYIVVKMIGQFTLEPTNPAINLFQFGLELC